MAPQQYMDDLLLQFLSNLQVNTPLSTIVDAAVAAVVEADSVGDVPVVCVDGGFEHVDHVLRSVRSRKNIDRLIVVQRR